MRVWYISFIHFPVNYYEPPGTFSLKLHAVNKNPAAKRKWISKYDRRAVVSNRGSVFHAEITAVYDRWRTFGRPFESTSSLSLRAPLFPHPFALVRSFNGASKSAIEILFTKQRRERRITGMPKELLQWFTAESSRGVLYQHNLSIVIRSRDLKV